MRLLSLGAHHLGSSPRGRGKRLVENGAGEFRRLIPARAGKTAGHLQRHLHGEAHPRAGGENVDAWGRDVIEPGSSPRGRGKRPVP